MADAADEVDREREAGVRKRKSGLGTGKGFSMAVSLVFVVYYMIVVSHGQSRKHAVTNEASFPPSFTRFG